MIICGIFYSMLQMKHLRYKGISVTKQRENQRENWSARSGFILAAIGSAVGLGNIWRFPYVTYENGGGAFLIPYLIALFTAGLPLLFLDYAIGHKYRGAPPTAYKSVAKPMESVGWWQVMVTLAIGVYYASVLSWAGSYIFLSWGQKWGEDTEAFFFNTYLQTGEGLAFGFVPHLFFGLLVVWAVTMFILYGGIKKGVEVANKIFIPLLIVLFTPLILYLGNKENIYVFCFVLFWLLTINHAAMRLAAPAFVYSLSLLKVYISDEETVIYRK